MFRLPLVTRYRRLPADPPPETLAETLKQASVATKAARRIDDFERLEDQAREHKKGQIKVALGAIGLLLGTAPAIPGVYGACHSDSGLECGLRIGAMVGAACALGCTLWAAYDLAQRPVHFQSHAKKLSEEIARAMQCRTGQVQVDALFDRYRDMSRDERSALKAFLHEAAKEPKRSTAMWRQAADALGV